MGSRSQGFQTTDPAYAGGAAENVDVKVWVDVKTWLPVRVDMNLKVNEQMEMQGTLHDFQWDVPVSAAEFTPVIPAGLSPPAPATASRCLRCRNRPRSRA